MLEKKKKTSLVFDKTPRHILEEIEWGQESNLFSELEYGYRICREGNLNDPSVI